MKTYDINRADIVIAIERLITGKNAWRNKQIIAMRLLDHLTYQELMEEFNMTYRQISDAVYKCENKVFAHIK